MSWTQRDLQSSDRTLTPLHHILTRRLDFVLPSRILRARESDYKVKTNLATELRDAIDMYQKDLDLGKLFEVLLPCFTEILRNGEPAFRSNSGEHVSTEVSSRRCESSRELT